MTLLIEQLDLSAHDWRFLSRPDKYVSASELTGSRKLLLECTKRQFRTAEDILCRLNGSHRQQPIRGVLLADDVGLGKTTVAALVAWVFAGSNAAQHRVRILAPNDTMVRRWESELLSHVELLRECASSLNVDDKQVKARKLPRLLPGAIQVLKHSYASAENILACDLLIIDEAHRAKGDGSMFSKALQEQIKKVKRVLILTATPFSIQIEELTRLLTLVGAKGIQSEVRRFSTALNDLGHGHQTKTPEVAAKHLSDSAARAVEQLKKWLIRYGIDDLPREQKAFGQVCPRWEIPVPAASPNDLELILRMDRAMRLAKTRLDESPSVTNDPRFHVGWRHLDREHASLVNNWSRLPKGEADVIAHHLSEIRGLRQKSPVHPKIAAVGLAVAKLAADGERVVIFCHHHLTAQELTAHLGKLLSPRLPKGIPPTHEWAVAWTKLLADQAERQTQQRDEFIKWLCSRLLRGQVWRWIVNAGLQDRPLVEALGHTPVRGHAKAVKTVLAAQDLLSTLLKSSSSKRVLKDSQTMPGENGTVNIVGICDHGDVEDERKFFMRNAQPDTVISAFNSPFGPDVLVTTDKLSEGIDLHRYCRHLIHYELDPSPIRTIQRNGRIRRVGGWASVTKMPIMYAYPAFKGTRDERVVRIMKNRVDSFGLLLGGGHSLEIDEVQAADEIWRDEVIAKAKTLSLSRLGKTLNAQDPRR